MGIGYYDYLVKLDENFDGRKKNSSKASENTDTEYKTCKNKSTVMFMLS